MGAAAVPSDHALVTCDERLGEFRGHGLHLLSVPSFDDWPVGLDVGSPHHALFVAADATGVPDASLLDAARRALASGARSVCAWGPESIRVERCFDRISIDEGYDGATDDEVVMTTSHVEALDEAVRYFLVCGGPAEAYQATCSAWVAVVVGSSELADRVRRALADPVATLAPWSSEDEEEEPGDDEAPAG